MVNARFEASQNFLKLRQPIDESTLPQPRVIEAGRTYRQAFTFAVPQQLLPSICTHTDSVHVRDVHLQPPPSLGHPSLARDGEVALDDLTPEMSKVTYAIKAKITRFRESDGKEVSLAEKLKVVRVIPASEELPPLSVNENGDDYTMHKQKGLRKGFFRVKLGCLSMEAAQSKSIVLPPPRSAFCGAPSTMAMVLLKFDPANDRAQPPRLGQLVSKLRVDTHFASRPVNSIPSKDFRMYDPTRGCYSESVLLSSRCMESARWQTIEMTAFSQLDPAVTLSPTVSSSTAIVEPTTSRNGKTSYATTLLVPIALPKDKSFVPTFHSCLISRVYVLELSLTAYTSSSSLSASTITLRLPLQISAAGSFHDTATLTDREQATAAADVEGFFQPRTISPPSDEYVQTSAMAPME